MNAVNVNYQTRSIVLALILLFFPLKALCLNQDPEKHSLDEPNARQGAVLYRWGIKYQNISLAAVLGQCIDFSSYHEQAIRELANLKRLNISVLSQVDFYTFSSTFLKFMLQRCNELDVKAIVGVATLTEIFAKVISTHNIHIQSTELPKMLHVSDVLLLKMEVEMLIRALQTAVFPRVEFIIRRKSSPVFEHFVARLTNFKTVGEERISFGNNRSNFIEKRFRCVERKVQLPKCPRGFKKDKRLLIRHLSSADIFRYDSETCIVPFNAFDISHGRRLITFLVVLHETMINRLGEGRQELLLVGKLLLDMVEEAIAKQAAPFGRANYMNGDNGWYKLEFYEYSNSYCYAGYGPSELSARADGFGFYFLSRYSRKIRNAGKIFQNRFYSKENGTNSSSEFYRLQVKPQLRVLEMVLDTIDD